MRRSSGLGLTLILAVGVASILLGKAATRVVRTQQARTRTPSGATFKATEQSRVAKAYAQLPLSFEPNEGQTNAEAKFLAHGPGYELFLTPAEAVVVMRVPTDPEVLKAHAKDSLWEHDFGHTAASVARMDLVGANPNAELAGQEKLVGKTNYLIGNDKAKWHTGISNYRKVAEHGIYPGIDLVYYGTQRQLEYDFIVAPASNPADIRLALNGATAVHVDANGDLVGNVKGGEMRLRAPVAYQNVAGAHHAVAAKYQISAQNMVAFNLGSYDRTKALVIDPVLAYSTYLGGSGIDGANSIAVASDGTAFVAGGTFSSDFPTAHALQPNQGGGPDFPQDGFVTKISADGSTLIYSTYLGGSSQDVINGVAVDSLGEAFVTGTTLSPDYPASITSVNSLCGGDGKCGATWNTLGLIVENGFITKLNIAGSTVVYSGFVGEYEDVHCQSVAVDAADNAYITGQTTENFTPTVTITPPATPPPPFPITGNAFQTTYGGGADDAFIAKVVATGNSYAYVSYLGGNNEEIGYGVAVDGSANAYITGLTYSTNFPTLNGIQTVNGGAGDAFFAKINTDGAGTSSLLYSTLMGGTGLDQGNEVAVDSSGNAFVVGGTNGGLPFTTTGTYGGQEDAFVAKINPAAAASASLLFFDYLGGSLGDTANGVAVDTSGNAYVTGSTVSTNFPVVQAFQAAFAGGNADAFVTKVTSTGAISYSSYLGGSNTDVGYGIAVDTSGSAYIGGQTCSYDFPLANPAQGVQGGNCDAFVTKVSTGSGITITPAGLTFQTTGAGSQSKSVTLTNGPSPLSISSIVLGGADPQDFTVSSTCGATVAANAQCFINVTFTPLATTLETAALIITDNAPGSPQVVGLSGNAATLTPDFGLVALTNNATVTAGQAAQYSVEVSALAGYTGSVTLSCTNLPRNSTCAFSTNPVSPSSNSLTTVNVTVQTTSRTMAPPIGTDRRGPPIDLHHLMLVLFGLVSSALYLYTRARTKPAIRAYSLALVLALAVAMLAVAACNGGGQAAGQPDGTPAGTYQIGITGTSGTLTHSAQVSLTVN